ncbi:MAG: hypothetical protein J7K64_03450 [Bacteroidales bacterium]|nr:hypothetical protein [Bacteroidales bacterium]
MNFKHILFIALLSILTSTAYAQSPKGVNAIDAKPNAITTFTGNLSNGFMINDLSWASSSSNACFPATQNHKFTGKHVLHAFKIPPYSEVYVTVIPKNKNANFSIYGYQVGTSNYSVVPNLSSCVSCEAEHKWDYPKKGKTQDHTRTIRFNSTNHSYNIFIGVTGADGLAEGEYTLEVNLKSRVQNNEEQKPLKMYSAKSIKGKTVAYKGDLADGVKIHDLSWASKSSVACFPATQNHKFTGNHIIFITEIPPHSKMDITVVPDNKSKNMSIYAYMVGTNNNAMVPNLNSCVTCEAEHNRDYKKRGKTQDHTRTVHLNAINNSYKVVIGIAGADGLTDGSFILKIKTE